MPDYYVHVRHDWTYKITADSPEEAESYVDSGDLPTGECTGYSIESVTLDEHGDGDDLRAPGQCKGCGKKQDPGRDECTRCLLDRLDREHPPVVTTLPVSALRDFVQ